MLRSSHLNRSGLLLAVTAATLLLLAGTASAKDRPLLAVLDFEGKNAGLNPDEVIALTEDARKVALEVLGDRYDIITRESLVDLLKSHGKTLEKCQGECETETGRLIGAELVVTGRVARVFGKYKLTVKIHQTDPPKLLGIQDANTTEMDQLPGLLHTATKTLLEKAAPQPTVQTGRRASQQNKPTKGDDAWKLETSATSFVTFISDPPGAEVWVDGTSIGTPASGKKGVTRRLTRGKHQVEMALTLYKPKAKTIQVRSARETVELDLDPNFAELGLGSRPSGLAVFIDGDQVGKTPIRGRRLIAGPHDFRIADRCHFEWNESVTVVPERNLSFTPRMKPKMAAVEVNVRFRGDDVPALLLVDGLPQGPTPGPYKVPLCSKKVQIVPEDDALNNWEQALVLEHREVWRTTAEVSDHASLADAAAKQAARERQLEAIGVIQIDTSFRSIGDMGGIRSTTAWQPAFLNRYLFVGIDTGWAVGEPWEETAWLETTDDSEGMFRLKSHWVATFNFMTGVQSWHSWGGFFLRGFRGWRWDADSVGEVVDGGCGGNSDCTAMEDGANATQLSTYGAEIGARVFLFGSDTVGLQSSYGKFDDGAEWFSIGIVSSLGEDSSDASNGLSIGQIFPAGLGTFVPLIIARSMGR